MGYLEPIFWAFIIFPVLAFLFTLPYLIYQYRKFGSVPFLRSLVLYSFVLYLLTVYFLVILPLPSIEVVEQMTSSYAQLQPFYFIHTFLEHTSLVWNDTSTYLGVIKEPDFYNVLFNIVMFVPFSIYLRYYFKCSLRKTILFSFLLSLFFELTQLSGLYGIYPRPYRLFDVDDLMVNTLGGMIGYGLTPFFSFFLPSKERIDKVAYERGKRVPMFRRMMAFGIDWFLFLMFISFLNSMLSMSLWKLIFYFSFYFIFIPFCFKGSTFGMSLLRIRIVSEDGSNCKWYQYILRVSLFYLVVGFFFFIVPMLVIFTNFWFGFFLGGVLFVYLFLYFCFRFLFYPGHRFFYERISHTKLQSTIVYSDEDLKKDTESL